MPIEAITGLPGHGKTAYVVSLLLQLEKEKETRTIYICGIEIIKELKLNLEYVTYEECKRWDQFKVGSLVVIDEVQELMPQRAKGTCPDYITDLSTHRHKGLDFWLITQDIRLLDVWARRLVNSHTHIKRLYGTNWQVAFNFPDRACDNVKDPKEKRTATKKLSKLPKHVYGVYKSSAEHNVKTSIPKAMIVTPIFIFILVPAVAYYLITNFNLLSDDKEIPPLATNTNQPEKYFTPPPPELSREQALDFIDNHFILKDVMIYGNRIIAHLLMTDKTYGTQHDITLDDFQYEKGLKYRLVSNKKLMLYQNDKRKSIYLQKSAPPQSKRYRQSRAGSSSILPPSFPNPFSTQPAKRE